MKKILLLGSGELGKEFVIAAMRAGQYVIACDRYDNAPAMQVADEREVFSMLDGDALEAVVRKHQPDIIVQGQVSSVDGTHRSRTDHCYPHFFSSSQYEVMYFDSLPADDCFTVSAA
jgi:dTDP-4-dehydrorhamnose reductase